MTIVFILGGLALLYFGGEALIKGAVSLGQWLGLSPLVAGVIIVGLGTSLPEMFVAAEAVWIGKPGIAVGGVFGSNIANLLLILGMAAWLSRVPRPSTILYPDGTILLAVTVLLVLLGMQGVLPVWQAFMLLLILFAYLGWEFAKARRQGGIEADEDTLSAKMSCVHTVGGLIMLPVGAHMLIVGATDAASALGVSDEVIGLSIVAIGTSLPELASTIVAATRGRSEVAYGNVLGSNLFNSLGVIGVAAFFGPLEFDQRVVWLDGFIMIAATCLSIALLSRRNGLGRRYGTIMLVAYAGYIAVRYYAN